MKIPALASALSLIGVLEFCGGAQAATTYYVSPTTGNDTTNSGVSPSSPYATIAKASGLVVPGDIVDLMGGNYSESIVPTASGTAAAPITYQAYTPGNPPVIVNPTAAGRVGILLSSVNYIVINGVNVNGGGTYNHLNNSIASLITR
jgi:hypothetical protein